MATTIKNKFQDELSDSYLLKKLIIFLLESKSIMQIGKQTVKYLRKNEIFDDIQGDVSFQALENGIYIRFFTSGNELKEYTWLKYCQLDDADLFFKDLNYQDRSKLLIDICFNRAMKQLRS